ncbi:hypothetical protein OUY22_06585 [Nonomuraea sp. MCN248]|uniref:DUF3558 domain-containing protein n=1 Tax=Nonomuraea corallina TaxID=2989783 RepID=A0ABT4S795_9ACTN|nr:hypothetical protein [Nonomuraea corallina]MDA0633082.1 hypothetical protein [Nonomuraea corallina]
MKPRFVIAIAVLGALPLFTACQQRQGERQVNMTPLPSVAAPPYVCDHIPLDAVRLMTGVQDPIVSGDFNMTVGKELDGKDYGSGACFIYQSTGNKPKVLQISLSPAGSEKEVEWEVSQGARRLPEIVPGAVGYYGGDDSADDTQAAAVLVHGLDEVIVELIHGVKGRDNAADVVAMMKLVAPKLILDATPAPEKTKD